MRYLKGNSTLKLVDDYCVVDIETSNADQVRGDIIELSSLKVRANEVVDTFSVLLKPRYPIDIHTMRIHNITNKMVQDAPTFPEIIHSFKDFIGDDILIGHNVHFDINYIYDNCVRQNVEPLKNDFIDTLRLSRRTYKGVQNYKLTTLATHFGYSATTHRGLDDCYSTHLVYQELKNRLSPKEIEALAAIKSVYYSHKESTIDVDPSNFVKTHPFYKRHIVLSGKMKQYSRRQASSLILNIGGFIDREVSSATNFLVLGDPEYQLRVFGGQSTKHLDALLRIQSGQGITILSEDEFKELVNNV